MKHLAAVIAFALVASIASAQQKSSQFILIIRSRAVIEASPEVIKSNIAHWTAWMTDLGKNGKIAGGYRPGQEGVTITGTDKTETASPYTVDGQSVSSFLIINAADMNEAKAIAAKCPVFELNGSVEVRPMQNTAN